MNRVSCVKPPLYGGGMFWLLFEEKIMKLLSTKQDLNDSLMDLIKNSEKKLIIISPFINFWDFKQFFQGRWDNLIELLKKKESILEIYTKHESINRIKRNLGINENKIIPIHNLHAKIYISDVAILLSSMNLTFSSFNRSMDFGVITQNNETGYNDIFEYYKENILIYNPRSILDDLSGHNIDAKIDQYFYLILKKNDNTFIQCSVEETDKYPDKLYFCFYLIKNAKDYTPHDIIQNVSKNHKINDIKYSSKRRRYYFYLKKEEYPVVSLIPVINMSQKEERKEKILDFFVEVYNCLNE